MTDTPTDRYAVVMYDVLTGDHDIYDVFIGRDALMAAVDMGLHEATSTRRPIILDVNELIVEAMISPAELAVLEANDELL